MKDTDPDINCYDGERSRGWGGSGDRAGGGRGGEAALLQNRGSGGDGGGILLIVVRIVRGISR